MNRTLRKALTILVGLCGIFVAGYLAWVMGRPPPGPVPGEPDLLPVLSPDRPGHRADSRTGPRLVPLEETQDFGILDEGGEANLLFTIRNEGEEIALVREVYNSCGCTSSALSSQEIPPGGDAHLEVTFHAGNFRGRIHKTIRILSNDPDGPAVLNVTGTVKPRVQADPEMVLFGRIRPGQKVTRKVVLIPSNPLDQLRPDPTRGAGGSVQITSARPLEGGRWLLELTACPDGPRDTIPSALLLPTGLPESPSSVVRISGEVVPP
jgi:hypothetical protein